MRTPNLDREINTLEYHERHNELTCQGTRTLKEYRELKQLALCGVSQQRELLKAYDRWDEENCYKLRHLNLTQRIHIFLEAFNCC